MAALSHMREVLRVAFREVSPVFILSTGVSGPFQLEAAEKVIVFDLARMRRLIEAGDLEDVFAYVRKCKQSIFDETIPAWFTAGLMWVCKQTYVRGVVVALVLDDVDITTVKTQMYWILDDAVRVNFLNAWRLTPSGTSITIPAGAEAAAAAGHAAAPPVVAPLAAPQRVVAAPAAAPAAVRVADAGAAAAAAAAAVAAGGGPAEPVPGAAAETPAPRRRPRSASSPAQAPKIKIGRGGGSGGGGGGSAGAGGRA